MAQRRFSQVDEAIARHNTRRQAKRSQSVYQRQVAIAFVKFCKFADFMTSRKCLKFCAV